MAMIEIQFQDQVFFEIRRAQLVRADLPRALFPELAPERLIERIEVGAAGFAHVYLLRTIAPEPVVPL
jgi:hypothetical protein